MLLLITSILNTCVLHAVNKQKVKGVGAALAGHSVTSEQKI